MKHPDRLAAALLWAATFLIFVGGQPPRSPGGLEMLLSS